MADILPPPDQDSTPPESSDASENAAVQDNAAQDAAATAPAQDNNHWSMIRKLAYLCLGVLIIFYAVWWASMYFMQDQIIFPRQNLPPIRADVPVDIIQFRHQSDEGEVVAWYMPAELTGGKTSAPAVIYFHDAGEIIDQLDTIAVGYHRLGLGVLLPEYRGHGRSGGTPSQQSIHSDLKAFYEQLLQRDDVNPQQIVYHGKGLGGAIALDFATEQPPRLLTLESTFTSGEEMFKGLAVPRFLIDSPYRTDQMLRALDAPVMVYHGRFDRQYPVESWRTLAEKMPNLQLSEFNNEDPGYPGLTNIPAFWYKQAELFDILGLIKLPRRPPPSLESPAAPPPNPQR